MVHQVKNLHLKYNNHCTPNAKWDFRLFRQGPSELIFVFLFLSWRKRGKCIDGSSLQPFNKNIFRSINYKIRKPGTSETTLTSGDGNIVLQMVSFIHLLTHTDTILFWRKHFGPPSNLNRTPNIKWVRD